MTKSHEKQNMNTSLQPDDRNQQSEHSMKTKVPIKQQPVEARTQPPDIRRRVNGGWLRLWRKVYPNTPPPVEGGGQKPEDGRRKTEDGGAGDSSYRVCGPIQGEMKSYTQRRTYRPPRRLRSLKHVRFGKMSLSGFGVADTFALTWAHPRRAIWVVTSCAGAWHDAGTTNWKHIARQRHNRRVK